MSISDERDCLERLEQLSANAATLIHSRSIGDLQVRVREYENMRWMQIGSEHIQALVDIDRPEAPLAVSSQAMLIALIFHPQPHSVLNLGVGGGSLERFFKAHLPNTRVASVEISETVLDVARSYFFLPRERPVTTASASEYLALNQQQHAIIFIDMFVLDSHPPCLFDSRFYGDCYRSLVDDGVLAINLVPKTEDELKEILIALRVHFDTVAIFNVDCSSNYIVFAMMPEFVHQGAIDDQSVQWRKQFKLPLRNLSEQMTWLPGKVKHPE